MEDGLITLFMQNHVNVAEVMKKGRVAVTRKKTHKHKLRRQPCRCVPHTVLVSFPNQPQYGTTFSIPCM